MIDHKFCHQPGWPVLTALLLGASTGPGLAQDAAAAAAQLPRYTGGQPAYADFKFHDGRFRPAVGVQNFQVLRANREHPEQMHDLSKLPTYPGINSGPKGFTYNHAPMLCHWKGKFWVQYLSCPVDETRELGHTLLTWSADGRSWVAPEVIFPAHKFLDRTDNREKYSASHQRMGFFVAKNGRLLTLSYYGFPPAPNNGKGIGRAVREIKGPGQFGPIHWIRYTAFQGYDRKNSPHYSFYQDSSDAGFREACEELLANKLMVQQWYEEDPDNADHLYAFAPESTRLAKAFSWYSLPDGKIVGLWKWKKIIVAEKWEEGFVKDLTGPTKKDGENIYYGGAKIWGQQLSDGRYALVYNPVKETIYRHPLAVTTSPDGLNFDQALLNVHSEVPPYRFVGENKDGGGGQYVRGIAPGNGTPPDRAMWLTYSSSKEDIWVAHVPVPIRGTVDRDVREDFEKQTPGGMVTDWNIYSGIWTPISVAVDGRNQVLRLEDKDPYDYAKAVRVFPETTKAEIAFRVRPRHDAGELQIDVLNFRGQRPVRLSISGGKIQAQAGTERKEIGQYTANQWLRFALKINTATAAYEMQLNGKPALNGAAFAEALSAENHPNPVRFNSPTVERIEFRTGDYRMDDMSRYPTGRNDYLIKQGDLPNADAAVQTASFDIDEVGTKTVRTKK